MSFLLRLVVAALTAFAGLMWLNAFLASDPSVSPMLYAILFGAGLVVSLWLAGKARRGGQVNPNSTGNLSQTPEQIKLEQQRKRAEEILDRWANQDPE